MTAMTQHTLLCDHNTKMSVYIQWCHNHLKWGAYSRWLSSLYCPMWNSDQMTIGTTHPTLLKDRFVLVPFGFVKLNNSILNITLNNTINIWSNQTPRNYFLLLYYPQFVFLIIQTYKTLEIKEVFNNKNLPSSLQRD